MVIFRYGGSSTHRHHEGRATTRKGHLTQDEGGEQIPTRGHFVITCGNQSSHFNCLRHLTLKNREFNIYMG